MTTEPRIVETSHYDAARGRLMVRRYNFARSPDLAKYVARERFAWPGGYELFAVTTDGAALCRHCCRAEFYQIAWDYHRGGGDAPAAGFSSGWSIVSIHTTAELDEGGECDHCGRDIS